jgi:membrane protein implicated in regulation of membrane protease activity
MQPPQNRPEPRPAIRIDRQADTQAFDAVGNALDRHRTDAALMSAVPPKLAKMLLPGEHVTFGTAVHPVVFVLPFVLLFAELAAADAGLIWLGHQPKLAWLLHGAWPEVGIGIAIAALALTAGLLVRRTFRFLALRVVATNRRIFAIRGVIVRRITPLGNTALAGSTLSQGIFGRMLGYGSIDLPLAEGTPETFRDMRDALQLYREFQAVAHGVDGDTWVPAVRQTIVP